MKYCASYFDDLDTVARGLPLSAFDGKTVCVTGATGLIGSSVADLLLFAARRLGVSVGIALTARDEQKLVRRFSAWDGGFSAIRWESGNEAPKERFDFVVHCAENAHPSVYASHPVETIGTALAGAFAQMQRTAENGGRFCYLSSSEVYGNVSANAPIRETELGSVDLTDARSCYPSVKRMIETLCACFGKEYGLNYVIVRPGHIYGPAFTKEDSRAFAQFARDALAGRDIVMTSAGMQLRSYCHALDCASAVLTVLARGKSGEAYNISNPHSLVTVRALAENFARQAGRTVVFRLPTDAEKAGYNRMTYSALDSTKLEALGWEGRIDPDRGVASTLACAEP